MGKNQSNPSRFSQSAKGLIHFAIRLTLHRYRNMRGGEIALQRHGFGRPVAIRKANEILTEQGHEREVGRGPRKDPERKIKHSARDPVDRFRAAELVDMQSDARSLDPKPPHKVWQDDQRTIVGHAQPKHPLGLRRIKAVLSDKTARKPDHLGEQRLQLARPSRQAQATIGPHKKRVREQGTQPRQGMTDRRLAHVQPQRSARDMPLLQQGVQDHQKIEIDVAKTMHRKNLCHVSFEFQFADVMVYLQRINLCRWRMSWQSLVLFGLPLLAGALIPIQTGANRMVAVRLESPLVAAGASMAIAAVVLISIGISSLRQGAVHAALTSLPVWAWAGGLMGAFFVTGAIVIAPRIGATSYLLMVFVGQMIMSVLADRLGLFGFEPRTVTPIQVLGLIGTMLSATLALGSFRP